MAKPAALDLVVYSGDTFTLVLTIQDEAGTPINITGRTYTAQIRETPEASAKIDLTATVTNGVGGELTVSLDASTTPTVPENSFWDLQEDASSIITTLCRGRVQKVLDVTR